MSSDICANTVNKADGDMSVNGGMSGDISDVWMSTNQDPMIRKITRKLVARSWDMLKLCSKVMEENKVLLSMMLIKDKLTERIFWEVDQERNFLEWKARNIKFLNLKDSKIKKEMKVSELKILHF
jgi:hypothetical protein